MAGFFEISPYSGDICLDDFLLRECFALASAILLQWITDFFEHSEITEKCPPKIFWFLNYAFDKNVKKPIAFVLMIFS